MRRAATVLAGLVLLIAAAAVPVAADTTGGGNQLQSFSSACGDTVCTDTTVSAYLDPSGGTACIEFYTYQRADGTFVSDENGCAPAPSFRISSTLAASFGPTSIPLYVCDQNSCTPTSTVTVSASDTPTGPITTTSGRSTTKDGTCTTKIKFTDRFVSVVGTYTIDGTTTAETGFVSTHTETSKTTCRI